MRVVTMRHASSWCDTGRSVDLGAVARCSGPEHLPEPGAANDAEAHGFSNAIWQPTGLPLAIQLVGLTAQLSAFFKQASPEDGRVAVKARREQRWTGPSGF